MKTMAEQPATEASTSRPAKYPIAVNDQADIKRRFTYHPPQDDQPSRYSALRNRAEDLAFDILEMVPPSRERSLALTKLEEAVMWANAGIARNE